LHINLRKSLFILPNLFTLSSIFCGFYAIVLCAAQPVSDDDLYRASMLIIFAMFFDTIDGRVARLTKTQSSFGVELDSLADVVSFGVAPALLVYAWALSPLGLLGVLVAFAFVACGAIRLARFNVHAMAGGADRGPDKYILGLPIPGAAGGLVSLVAANHKVSGHLSNSPLPILIVVLVLSFFMVSTIKFRSFKDLRMNWRTVLLVSFALGSSVTIAVTLHVAFALGWLLVSYVAIGLVEGIISLSRRAIGHRQVTRQ